jgi:hypothetical protein
MGSEHHVISLHPNPTASKLYPTRHHTVILPSFTFFYSASVPSIFSSVYSLTVLLDSGVTGHSGPPQAPRVLVAELLAVVAPLVAGLAVDDVDPEMMRIINK